MQKMCKEGRAKMQTQNYNYDGFCLAAPRHQIFYFIIILMKTYIFLVSSSSSSLLLPQSLLQPWSSYVLCNFELTLQLCGSHWLRWNWLFETERSQQLENRKIQRFGQLKQRIKPLSWQQITLNWFCLVLFSLVFYTFLSSYFSFEFIAVWVWWFVLVLLEIS